MWLETYIKVGIELFLLREREMENSSIDDITEHEKLIIEKDKDKYLAEIKELRERKKKFMNMLLSDYGSESEIYDIFNKKYYKDKGIFGESQGHRPSFEFTLKKARDYLQYNAVAKFIQEKQAEGNHTYDKVIDLLIEIDKKYSYLLSQPKKKRRRRRRREENRFF